MASGSTPDEAQTFQISRRQLFSHLRCRARAGKGSGPWKPDAAQASSQRPQTTLVTEQKTAASCE